MKSNIEKDLDLRILKPKYFFYSLSGTMLSFEIDFIICFYVVFFSKKIGIQYFDMILCFQNCQLLKEYHDH